MPLLQHTHSATQFLEIKKKTRLDNLIEGGITSQAEVTARDVVADGGRDDNHWDAELGVLSTGLVHLEQCMVGLEATHNQDGVHLILPEACSNLGRRDGGGEIKVKLYLPLKR